MWVSTCRATALIRVGPICEDPRQAVPPTGQKWTSLAELGESRKNILIEDVEDSRLTHIGTDPPFAINQHRGLEPLFERSSADRACVAFLIESASGSYIWDCCAFLSPALIDHLSKLKTPLKAIAISHPHVSDCVLCSHATDRFDAQFFSTSLTWSRALNVPLYLCEADKEWFYRSGDVTETDQLVWFTGSIALSENIKVVQCGG